MGGCRREEAGLSVRLILGGWWGRRWRGLPLLLPIARVLLSSFEIVPLSSRNVIEYGLWLLDDGVVEIVVLCETVGLEPEPALLVEGRLELALGEDADGGHGVVLVREFDAAAFVDETLLEPVVAVALGVVDH
jgi:hypothetical protein